jgi:hypothetical protein
MDKIIDLIKKELVFDKIYEILKEHNISVDELMD